MPRRRDFASNRTTPFRRDTPAAENNNAEGNNRYAHRARYVDPTDEELRKYPHRAKYYEKREEYIAKEDEYNTNRCFPDRQEHFDENDNFDDVEDSQLIGFYNQGSNRKDFLGLTWRHYFSFETARGNECIGSWMTKKGHLTVDEKKGMQKAQPGDSPEGRDFKERGKRPNLQSGSYHPFNSKVPKRGFKNNFYSYKRGRKTPY